MQTRREFLMTSAMCVLISSGTLVSRADSTPETGVAPPFLEGDPYTAHADECGLGGRSFDAAREHALRFRSGAADRDRFVLGLEEA
jgi:hypothetical protein